MKAIDSSLVELGELVHVLVDGAIKVVLECVDGGVASAGVDTKNALNCSCGNRVIEVNVLAEPLHAKIVLIRVLKRGVHG